MPSPAFAPVPSLPGRARVVASRRSALVDLAVTIAAFGASFLLSSGHASSIRPGPESIDWIGGLLLAATTLPLLVWRRAPRGVFVITTSASILTSVLGYSIGLMVGPAIALYLWTSSRDERDAWARRDTDVVVGGFVAYLAASAVGDRGFPGIELLHSGLAFGAAWFAGERTRLRRERILTLEERATRAEQELDRDRRLAVAEERTRIARDLHDSVGHAINVIAVRAGAARLRAGDDPAAPRRALETIEEIARETAAEIDHLVRALRDRSDGDSPRLPLGLGSAATLVARSRSAGLDVQLTRRGENVVPDAAVDVAAYRILQEALTNATRHGAGCAAVELNIGPDAVDLVIANPVPTTGGAPATPPGHGIPGMTERADLVGGTLTTVLTSGEFRLAAYLPYHQVAR